MTLEKYLVLLRQFYILKPQEYSKFHKILVFNCVPSVVRLEELLFLSLSL